MKDVLRRDLLVARNLLSADYMKESSKKIATKCEEWLITKKIQVLALYHPIGHEVDVLLLNFLYANKISLALPVEYGFALWKPEDKLLVNKYGIKQPASDDLVYPDVIIVPLLGFDRKGNRIGYGGGFYDKVLATMPAAVKVGVAYSVQERDSIPHEDHDIKLDLIITEKEVIIINDSK